MNAELSTGTDFVLDSRLDYDEYCAFRKSVEWDAVSKRQFDILKEKSDFISVARINGRAVGMVRVTGDGGYIFALADVMVMSDSRNRGIGRTLVAGALEYINSLGEQGEACMIMLLAAKGREEFYSHFGFVIRPDDRWGAGMHKFIRK